jgi:circadian clock protein KaiB
MKCKLILFITGRSLASQHAVTNLYRLCEGDLSGVCEYEVIDILENPEIAEREKILATPTLVKMSPGPVRKIIGDLSQRGKVLFGLGLDITTLGRSDRASLETGNSEDGIL